MEVYDYISFVITYFILQYCGLEFYLFYGVMRNNNKSEIGLRKFNDLIKMLMKNFCIGRL